MVNGRQKFAAQDELNALQKTIKAAFIGGYRLQKTRVAFSASKKSAETVANSAESIAVDEATQGSIPGVAASSTSMSYAGESATGISQS